MDNLNEEQKKVINEFKQLPKKMGRPPKEFGPLLKLAAAVLRDAGMSNKDIALELKVSPITVAKIFKDKTIEIDVKDLDKVREGFTAHVAGIVSKLLTAANSEEYVAKLGSVKNPSLIIAITQMLGALNNLTGKPSSIVEVRDAASDVQKKIREIEDLQQALRQNTNHTDNPKTN